MGASKNVVWVSGPAQNWAQWRTSVKTEMNLQSSIKRICSASTPGEGAGLWGSLLVFHTHEYLYNYRNFRQSVTKLLGPSAPPCCTKKVLISLKFFWFLYHHITARLTGIDSPFSISGSFPPAILNFFFLSNLKIYDALWFLFSTYHFVLKPEVFYAVSFRHNCIIQTSLPSVCSYVACREDSKNFPVTLYCSCTLKLLDEYNFACIVVPFGTM